MRVPGLVIAAYLRRGAIIWLTMRLCVSGVLLLGGDNPLHPSVPTTFAFVWLTVGLTVLDIRRRHEQMLIGNLGLRPVVVSLLTVVPAATGETGLRVVATLIS